MRLSCLCVGPKRVMRNQPDDRHRVKKKTARLDRLFNRVSRHMPASRFYRGTEAEGPMVDGVVP